MLHLAILVPTRQRPEALEALVRQLQVSCAAPEAWSLWVLGEAEDLATQRVVASLQAEGLPLRAHWASELPTQGARYRALVAAWPGEADLYMVASDKLRWEGVAWDEVIRRHALREGDRPWMAFPQDQVNGQGFGTFPILSRAWVELLGLGQAHFPFWYDDTWLNEVGRWAGCAKALPLKVQLQAGKTRHLAHLPFWEALYRAQWPLRLAEAEQLLRHLGKGAWLEANLGVARRLAEASRLAPAARAQHLQRQAALEARCSARLQEGPAEPEAGSPYWHALAQAEAWLRGALSQAEAPEAPQGWASELAWALSLGEGAHQASLEALNRALRQAPEAELLALLGEHRQRFPWRPAGPSLLAKGSQARGLEALHLAALKAMEGPQPEAQAQPP